MFECDGDTAAKRCNFLDEREEPGWDTNCYRSMSKGRITGKEIPKSIETSFEVLPRWDEVALPS